MGTSAQSESTMPWLAYIQDPQERARIAVEYALASNQQAQHDLAQSNLEGLRGHYRYLQGTAKQHAQMQGNIGRPKVLGMFERHDPGARESVRLHQQANNTRQQMQEMRPQISQAEQKVKTTAPPIMPAVPVPLTPPAPVLAKNGSTPWFARLS